MSKTFNEQQMADPWQWALDVLERHEIKSADLADHLGTPRSTIRSLMNGTNANPKYATLLLILAVCIQLENGINLVSVKSESDLQVTLNEIEYDWM